jgi:EAL domain-containing protein (putative c-di-GMP-specific phosphodiesterase class I)
VDIATGRVIGAEALVRWQHPDLGLVFPLQFIPAAEETGLIVPIGEWVLRTACAQNKAWQDARLPSIRMAVNLSATQFQQQDLVETVARVLKEAGLDPRFLDLEIIESTAMQDADFSVATMRALREMGVQVSIDDFGTGYSSLNYLKRFPISAMKIDQSFVQDISEDSNSAAIVSTIIVLAQNMKLRSVAEGVETEEQLAFLKQRGCDEMQGFLFSRPVPADAFEKMLVAQADSPRPPKNGKSRKRRQAVGATR